MSAITRDTDIIAFEKAFPGVTATKVSIWATEYEFECEAPGETLKAVGLISRDMLDRMAGTSSQIGFGPRANKPANFCPYHTQLRYRSERGRPTDILTMRRWRAMDVAAFCATIGVEGPTKADIAEAAAQKAKAEAQLCADRRQAYDAGVQDRRGSRKLWSSDGVLISVDWSEIRSRVTALRSMGALS